MTRRTIVGATLALIAAAAIPLGLPRVVSAAGFDSIVFSPGPIAQAGALTTASTVVNICVQPESGGAHVAGTVWLSIDSGKFATAPTGGGSAMVGATALTSTPQSFPTVATCNFTGPVGSAKDGVMVQYTSPPVAHTNGRDVITAADSAADSGSNGVCGGGVCNTDTYVFSPVMSYVFSNNPIATTGTLTTGELVTFTVTALDNSSTPQPVPGAYLDLSLASTGSGGSATAINDISVPPSVRHLTNSPARVGATNSGTVSITYTAGNVSTATGMDTITAQDHPTATVSATTSYTYTTTTAPPSNPYTAVAPFRICDTRPVGPGIASNQCNTGVGSGALASGAARAITVDGLGGVPASGVTAVVVNVTGIAPAANTFLTLYPDGSSNPGTSNLNPLKGGTVANLVEVGVSAAGKFDVSNAAHTGSINVAIDVEGYVWAGPAGIFTAATAPVRICDTRVAGHGIPANRCNTSGASPIQGGATLTFNVNGGGSPVPVTALTAVVFNLTGITPTKGTVLTAFSGSKPNASNLNIAASATHSLANRVIVPVACSGGNCTVSIWNAVGSINIAVDIDGWFTTSGTHSTFTAMPSPARVCDTRFGNVSDQGCARAEVGTQQILNISVTNIDGIPSNATAIVATLTAVGASAGTFITAYPGPLAAGRPNASDINVATADAVPNLIVVGVGSDGTINLYNAVGSVNLIVDVLGYYS